MTNILFAILLYSSYYNMIDTDMYKQSIPFFTANQDQHDLNPFANYMFGIGQTNIVFIAQAIVPLAVYCLFGIDAGNIIINIINVCELLNIYRNDIILGKNNLLEPDLKVNITLFQYQF